MGEIIRGFPYNSTLPHFEKCAESVKCRNSGFQGHGWTWLVARARWRNRICGEELFSLSECEKFATQDALASLEMANKTLSESSC